MLKVVDACKLTVFASLIWSITGCSTLQYYAQAVGGHAKLLRQRVPVEKALDLNEIDSEVHRKLALTKTILAFARGAGLPTGNAYTSYVQTGKPYVVWIVMAAPEFSLDIKQFCFPVVGCTAYKGFFKKETAEREASRLQARGYDVHVGGVSAYSTLGWFSDPVLDSFLNRSDVELAAVLFHELAHRELYVTGDSHFNESYATTVERFLLEEWLRKEQRTDELQVFRETAKRKLQVLELAGETRTLLAGIYHGNASVLEKRENKRNIIEQMRSRYLAIHEGWGGHDDYHSWMTSDINNAKLATLSVYNDWVDSFRFILAEEQDNIPDFLNRVRKLAKMKRKERDRLLSIINHL